MDQSTVAVGARDMGSSATDDLQQVDAAPNAVQTQAAPTPGWIVAAFAYVAFGSALAPADAQILGTSLVFLVLLFVGTAGLRQLQRTGALTSYALGVVPLAIWVPVSAIAAWDPDALYRSFGLVAWFVVIPGIAAWLRLPAVRATLVAGFVLNAAIFCGEIIRRVVATGSALDPSLLSILGSNRNAVAAVLAFLVPLVAAGRRWRAVRFVGVIVLLASIAALGSRSALIAAVAALGLLVVLAGRRELLLVVPFGAIILCFWLVAPAAFSSVAGFTVERFGSLRDEQVLPEEELRGLLLHKAVLLGRQHPLFGVGLGNVETTTSGIAGQARFRVNRDRADHFQVHNTFAEALAAFGFVGGFFYLLFALMPVWIGIRRRSNQVTRGPTAAYVALLIWSVYHSALGANLLLLAVALVLGAAMTADENRDNVLTGQDRSR